MIKLNLKRNIGGYGNSLAAMIRIRNDKVWKISLPNDTIFFIQTLTTLDLSGQEIDDQGIKCIANALADNRVDFLFFLSLFSLLSILDFENIKLALQ